MVRRLQAMPRFAPARWLGLLLVVALGWPLTGAADLATQFSLEYTTLQRFETANAFLTISNRSPEELVLNPNGGEGQAWVELNVRRMTSRSPVTLKGKPVPVRGVLEPGEGRRFMIDVTSLFGLSEIGTYNVSATVRHDGLNYESRLLSLEVVGGLPLKRVSEVAPNRRGVVRDYSLTYLSRDGHEHLLLSIDEDVSSLNLGVFVLGPIVRVFDPVLTVDGQGTVTVVHQTGPQQYARSILQTTAGGVRLVDQSYEKISGQMGADGKWTAPGSKPVVPPGVTPAPAPKKKGFLGF